jgi:hypothetical protein
VIVSLTVRFTTPGALPGHQPDRRLRASGPPACRPPPGAARVPGGELLRCWRAAARLPRTNLVLGWSAPRTRTLSRSRRQFTTWAMTAESFARHDCSRRHAAPSSSGHGRSPGDHPCWLGLRPRRQLRQQATEERPRQRRWATRTPPRHGTAATCALAKFLVVVVQRGGRRFGSCSYRQGGQFLAGRSPSGDTLLCASTFTLRLPA